MKRLFNINGGKSCLALALAIAGIQGAGTKKTPEEPKVFYFGLLTNTSGPIDEVEIERYYDLSSPTRRILPRMLELLAVDEGPSTSVSNIRLKIVRPGRPPVMLDLEGNVSGLGKRHRISLETRMKLQKLIAYELPDDLTFIREHSRAGGGGRTASEQNGWTPAVATTNTTILADRRSIGKAEKLKCLAARVTSAGTGA
jgi:hypothetical protein